MKTKRRMRKAMPRKARNNGKWMNIIKALSIGEAVEIAKTKACQSSVHTSAKCIGYKLKTYTTENGTLAVFRLK